MQIHSTPCVFNTTFDDPCLIKKLFRWIYPRQAGVVVYTELSIKDEKYFILTEYTDRHHYTIEPFAGHSIVMNDSGEFGFIERGLNQAQIDNRDGQVSRIVTVTITF